MKNGLYRIEVRSQLEELRNGGHVMIIGDGGMAFAEIHPIKIKKHAQKGEDHRRPGRYGLHPGP